MTVAESFRAFKSNLELPDAKFGKASRAQQDIRAALEKRLPIYDSFLSGSYARHTKIDPLKDVDIILVRNSGPVGLSTDGSGTHPHQALAQVEAAVRQSYPPAAVKVQSRSVNVEIPGLGFGFDLVPAWQRAPDGYWIPDADTGGWLASDPVYHKTIMTDANTSTGGRLKPIVKMMKHWNAMNFDLLRSFHVELLCKDICLQYNPQNFQLGVGRVLVELQYRVGKTYMDPAYGQSRVDKPLSQEELAKLVSRLNFDAGQAIRAVELEQQGKHNEAISLWKSVFASGFA